MTHVSEPKKKKVAELVRLMTDYPVTAVVSVESIPAPQLQKVRAQIRNNVVMTMAKRRIIKIALDKSKELKKGIEKLKDNLNGMPALMFTKENPFKLSATLMKSKSKAPAKAGQTAPNDILVEAGPTSFAPGPVIGELGQLGIKTSVENGKIAIKENKVLVKKGEKVSDKAAALLTRLGIEPMEIGLMPEAAYDDGIIFTRDVLEVDEKEYLKKLNIAESEAFNLACEIKYPAKEVVELLVGKAFNEAKEVGVEFNIIDREVIDSLMGIAENDALSLKNSAGIEVPEKKVEEPKAKEKKEQGKPEEKPEEKKEVRPSEAAKEKANANSESEAQKPEEKKEELKTGERKQKKESKDETSAEAVKEEKREEKTPERHKEEPKKEKEKTEEKKELAEEPKEKPEEKKEEPKEEVDKKIEEMVQKTKDFAEGKIPSAEKLVDEAEETTEKEKKEKEEKARENKEKEPEKIPSAHELAKKKEKNTSSKKEVSDKRKKEEKEISDVQDIVKKLQRGEKL